MEFLFSPDLILSAWLGSKHQLTDQLALCSCMLDMLFVAHRAQRMKHRFILPRQTVRQPYCVQERAMDDCMPLKVDHPPGHRHPLLECRHFALSSMRRFRKEGLWSFTNTPGRRGEKKRGGGNNLVLVCLVQIASYCLIMECHLFDLLLDSPHCNNCLIRLDL